MMSRACCLALLLFSRVCCATELVLYNWDEYLSGEVIELFERETGIQVRQVYFDSDEERDEVLLTDARSGFDLALVDNIAVQVMGDNHVFSPLEDSSRKLIEARWRKSCGAYGVPYAWGTFGIVYRADKVSVAPTSWVNIVEPEKAMQGHISWLADHIDTFIPLLKLSGESINTTDKAALKRAYSKLSDMSELLASYTYVLTEVSRDPQAPIYMALAYSGDQYVLNDLQEGEFWAFVTPQEGTSIWVDCISVLSSSTKQLEAKAFIAFLNRPEIAALNASNVWLATPNSAALTLVDEDLLNDRTVYPDVNTLTDSELYINIEDANITQRVRILRALEKRYETQ